MTDQNSVFENRNDTTIVNPNASLEAPVEVALQKENTKSSQRYQNELKKSLRRSNIPMILMLFIIIIFGIVVLYSVSGPTAYANPKIHDSAYYVKRQIAFTIVGLVLALGISHIPVHLFEKFRKYLLVPGYVVSLVLIIFTSVAGKEINGARRWIHIGTDFQTSEILKISIILCFAIYRTLIIQLRKEGRLIAKDPKNQDFKYAFFDFILPVGLILLLDMFVLIQPHFSCFIIIGIVTVVCFLCAGIPLKSWIIGMLTYVLLLGVLLVAFFAFAPASIKEKASDKIQSNFAHVFERLDIYSAKNGDDTQELSEDETLQLDRAQNALGSGGFWGMGLGNSRSKYNYVPEAHNDYIFSILVEELGMVGGLILIIMYLIIFFMGFSVASHADSVFCRILAMGYSFLIILEAFFNISVQLGVVPPTGITLPFISYGGTAQIFLLISYGMILCVSRSGTLPKKVEKMGVSR